MRKSKSLPPDLVHAQLTVASIVPELLGMSHFFDQCVVISLLSVWSAEMVSSDVSLKTCNTLSNHTTPTLGITITHVYANNDFDARSHHVTAS